MFPQRYLMAEGNGLNNRPHTFAQFSHFSSITRNFPWSSIHIYNCAYWIFPPPPLFRSIVYRTDSWAQSNGHDVMDSSAVGLAAVRPSRFWVYALADGYLPMRTWPITRLSTNIPGNHSWFMVHRARHRRHIWDKRVFVHISNIIIYSVI